jgi:hypothetical protein
MKQNTSLKRDKLLAVAAAALLGYYLGLSLLHAPLWQLLLGLLPPINNRHLPTHYPGLIGAALLGAAAYLLFTAGVERKPFRTARRQYAAGLTLLVALPLLIAGAFRLQAAGYVAAAERTVPTDIHVTLSPRTPGSQIMFRTSPDTATGVPKSASVPAADLPRWGELIRELKLQEVVGREKALPEPRLTLWVNYHVQGRWYSKILNYHQGIFEEEAAGERRARYVNEELARALEDLIKGAGDLSRYSSAQVYNTRTKVERAEPGRIQGAAFTALVQAVQAARAVDPAPAVAARFAGWLRSGVPEGETRAWAVLFLTAPDTSPTTRTRRSQGSTFLVYDAPTKIFYFEGRYYQADLSPFLTLPAGKNPAG